MADEFTGTGINGLPAQIDRADESLQRLMGTAASFARVMTTAFAQSVASGRVFDETLKSLGLRVSGIALQAALKPLGNLLTNGFAMLSGSTGVSGGGEINLKAAAGAIKPFAAGGVIGTPSYFPLSSGGIGLAGEAGPEAIMPLSRGADGKLGVAAAGSGGASHITVNIATSDAESFRRSEVYLTGQIARAVARGQRGM